MKPYQYKGKVIRVIDGDTIEAEIDLGFYMTTRLPVRLAHMNAKERNQIGGKEATEHLKKLLGDGEITLETFKPEDKYGRYLAVILKGKKDINQQMIKDGFAVGYEGGAR